MSSFGIIEENMELSHIHLAIHYIIFIPENLENCQGIPQKVITGLQKIWKKSKSHDGFLRLEQTRLDRAKIAGGFQFIA